MMEFDYIDDISIDPHELDEEWLQQPALYMKYAEVLATAQKERDKAKEKIDVIKADLDKDIRLNPDKYELSKITVDAVNATIIRDIEYREAVETLNEKNYEVNIYSSAVKALDQKKKALEGLVTLLLTNWFSGPKEPRILKKGKRIATEFIDNQTDKQRDQINRRRKK